MVEKNKMKPHIVNVFIDAFFTESTSENPFLKCVVRDLHACFPNPNIIPEIADETSVVRNNIILCY